MHCMHGTNLTEPSSSEARVGLNKVHDGLDRSSSGSLAVPMTQRAAPPSPCTRRWDTQYLLLWQHLTCRCPSCSSDASR